MNLTAMQSVIVNAVVNEQISVSRAIRRALNNGELEFADYLKTF